MSSDNVLSVEDDAEDVAIQDQTFRSKRGGGGNLTVCTLAYSIIHDVVTYRIACRRGAARRDAILHARGARCRNAILEHANTRPRAK